MAREAALELLAASGEAGEAFFPVAARALALGLGRRRAGVSLLDDDRRAVRTVAVWEDGEPGPCCEEPLAGSRWAALYAAPCHSDGWPPASACAAPVAGPDGATVGHVFAEPGGCSAAETDFLRLVAGRVAAALTRSTAERTAARHGRDVDARLRRALDVAQEGLALYDADRRLIFSNRRYRELAVPVADMVRPNMLFDDLVQARVARGASPEARGREAAYIAERIAAFVRRDVSYVTELLEGVWVQIRHERLPGGGTLVSALDVTEIRQGEQALRASEKRFEDLARSSSDWFWETDAEHRFTWFSDEDDPRAGPARRDLIGRRREEVSAGPTDGEAWQRFRQALARREPFRDFVYALAWQGGARWIRASGVPVFDGEGRFAGYRGTASDATAELAGQAEARRAQERLAAAVEAMTDMFSLWDVDDRFVLCNARFREMNDRPAGLLQPGLHFAEMLRQNVAAGCYPDAEAREAFVTDRMARRQRPGTAFEQRRQDGRWLLVRDRRLADGGMVTIATDITDLKRAEAALRASEQRFQHFAAASGDWFWETDADHRFTWFSEQGQRALANPPIYYFGKRREDFAETADDPEAWQRHREALVRHEPFRDFVYRVKGTLKTAWTRSSGVPVFDETGRFCGYRGIASDVTEQIKARLDAATANDRLATAVELLSELFALWGSDDRLVLCNARFRALFADVPELCRPGISFAEHLWAVVSRGRIGDAIGREREWFEERMARRRDPGEPFEIWHAAAGLWLLIRECRLPDGSVVSIGSDITEQKAQQTALQRAKEEAERANRAKSQFLANMSHELRTPLNAVIGFSDILRSESFGPLGKPRYREYAEDIWRSGSHLLDLINDVLDLSKIEAGRLELTESEVDLAALAADVVGMVAEQAGAAGLAIVNRIPAGFAPIRVDERAIRQVLINLLSNAVKFSLPGGTVTLTAGIVESGVRIAVADTGIGMSPEEQRLALEPFGQVESVLQRRHRGTGLGLPIARSLVELHQGSLDIDSAPGKGTTITVMLPRARIARAA